jgi:ATP-dependent DNA ligase
LTKDEMKNCRWLKPEQVMIIVQQFNGSRFSSSQPLNFGQIEVAGWTPDGHLRHSKFVGLRDDKDADRYAQE